MERVKQAGYHLSIGEQRDLRHCVNNLRHIDITPSAIAHVALQHGFGHVLYVLLRPSGKIKLVLEIIDVILFLIAGNSSTPCERKQFLSTWRQKYKKLQTCMGLKSLIKDQDLQGRHLPLRRLNLVLHWGQT